MTRWTTSSLRAGVLVAGLLGASVPLFAAEWVYFQACGFSIREDIEIDGVHETVRAPNIEGFWVPLVSNLLIVDWKEVDGIPCSSIYVWGAENPVHVIGTTDEVMRKLRTGK